MEARSQRVMNKLVSNDSSVFAFLGQMLHRNQSINIPFKISAYAKFPVTFCNIYIYIFDFSPVKYNTPINQNSIMQFSFESNITLDEMK